MLELTAKIIEKDGRRRDELIKALGHYMGVEVVVVDDQVNVVLTGGANRTTELAGLMRLCELHTCHMFRLRKLG